MTRRNHNRHDADDLQATTRQSETDSAGQHLLTRRRALKMVGALAMISGSSLSYATTAGAWKPTKSVRLINGFSPGGAADILCRLLAQALSPLLGQSVVVETKTGAGGFIAADAIARSAPDGHTIGLATMGMLTISSQLRGANLPLDVQKDLTPITTVAGIYSLLVAYPGAPFKTVPELIAYAKAHPKGVSYASSGIGSAPNLAAEMFCSQAGVDIVHIPYRGGAQALIDLIAGRVDILIGNMPDFLPQVKSGQIRAIAFAGERAAPALPDLPLIKQWLPDYSVTNWFGMVAPAGMPPEVLQAWNRAFQTVLADPTVRTRMIELGMEVLGGTTDQFRALITSDRARWNKIITSANITLE